MKRKGEYKIMNYTSLFSGNMTNSTTTLIPTIPSISTGGTVTSGVGSIGAGSTLIKDEGDSLDTTAGLSTISTGISLAGNSLYSVGEQKMQQLLTTQAYVESLGEEELVALMARLEMKEDELTACEEKSSKTI